MSDGGGHLGENAPQVLGPGEVAVLVAAGPPGRSVADADAGRQGGRLGEIDQPDAGSVSVVDEQQRRADELGTRSHGGKSRVTGLNGGKNGVRWRVKRSPVEITQG